jgi:serine/threonine protein kinase
MSAIDSALLSRYEILQELGRGGMGSVVKARDLKLLRLVAIKFVESLDDPSFVERLTREAQATALLSHPNIVTIFDTGQTGNSAFIVMEYVAGHTLQTRMTQLPPAEWRQFLPALALCGDALDYAHRKGITHRDVKPSNVMLSDESVPKLLDFGIAKVLASRENSITQAGSLLGTPLYMAPEQATGGAMGPRTDQYALALIAYQLLVGSHPFQGLGTVNLIYEIVEARLPAPSTLNPGLASAVDIVLLQALSKDPARRFASCKEFFDRLNAALSPSSAPITGVAPARSSPGLFGALRRIFQGEKSKPDPEPASKSQAVLHPQAEEPKLDQQPALQSQPVALPDIPAKAIPPSPVPRLTVTPPASVEGEFTRMFHRPDQTAVLRKAPDQRRDPDTIARAQSRELQEILVRRDFESAVSMRGKWLPGIEGATSELIGFSEAARYLGAAQGAVSPHVRIEHLKRADKVLFSVGNQLLADSTSAASRHLPEALEKWKSYTRDLLAATQEKAASELPNPFRAGQPLRPDQGRSVFRGRTALVRSMEAILADTDQNSSLALLGPRRCGKTSLLQMLPAILPDCACVFFDLQDNPVSSVDEFFRALQRRAQEQVRAQRRLDIPGLPAGSTFESATQWLDELDRLPDVNRFLLCIDEFERLESLFPGDRRDLLRLMGLFRATIQHRNKVRLLVSGVAPFEELGPLWNDHFINVRELRIGHLDESTSIELLSAPIPEFPPNAVPPDIARQIFRRTAGQPYLLQLFGALLVNRLNSEERTTAVLDDVPAVEQEALLQGRYYFGNTYQDAPADARIVLEALARGETPLIHGSIRSWLQRRCLIDEHGYLRTPVLGVFIREELGL